MSCVEPSLNVPVAFSCTLPPEFTEGFGGVIVILLRVAGVTVSDAEPEVAPDVAVAEHVPALTADAMALALTVQTEVRFEDQLTEFVTSWLLPSVRTALAANCKLVPFAKLAVVGLT